MQTRSKSYIKEFIAALHSLYSTECLTCQVNFHDRDCGQYKECREQIEKSYLSYLKERAQRNSCNWCDGGQEMVIKVLHLVLHSNADWLIQSQSCGLWRFSKAH